MTQAFEGTAGEPETAQGGSTTQVQERAQEVAGQAAEQAREQAGNVRERARRTVDDRTSQAGGQVRSLVDAMRQTSEQLRSEGKDQPARVNDRAAELLERIARYLDDADADRMLGDIEKLGRRRPWTLAAAGAAVGLVAGRFLRASARRRYEGRETSASAGTLTAGPRPAFEDAFASTQPAPGGLRSEA